MSDEKPPNLSQEKSSKVHTSEQELQSSLERIAAVLRGLKFGNVNVIVQDGVVIQIDRTEKHRLRKSSRSDS
jgi:hypothetical protein